MSSIGIAELTALGAAPASGDLLVIVDIDDTSQSLAGSTKNLTVANLFTSPTMTGTTTVAALTISGNVAVNTNKFTVAAASGNTVVAGTLGVAGMITSTLVTGTVLNNQSGTTSEMLGRFSNTSGNINWGVESSTGGSIFGSSSAYAAVIGTVLAKSFQIATNNTVRLTVDSAGAVVGTSTITGTRHIGGTDITSAVAPGVFGDGTALGSNDTAIASILGTVTSISTASSSGTIAVSDTAGKQTVASSGTLDVLRGVVWAAHTSGTLVGAIGIHGSGQFDGNGGTTTSADMVRGGNFNVGTGHTVTTLRAFHATTGAKTGTITTQVGLEVDAVTLGTNNYAIRTQADCSLFNGSGSARPTNATVGFVHIPTCAGPPTGVPANLVTGAIPMVIDSTNKFLYLYLGGAWTKSTVYA